MSDEHENSGSKTQSLRADWKATTVGSESRLADLCYVFFPASLRYESHPKCFLFLSGLSELPTYRNPLLNWR